MTNEVESFVWSVLFRRAFFLFLLFSGDFLPARFHLRSLLHGWTVLVALTNDLVTQ